MKTMALAICAALAATGAMAQEQPDFDALSETFTSITVLRCEAQSGVRYFVFKEEEGGVKSYGVQNGVGERIASMQVERIGERIAFSDDRQLDVISSGATDTTLASMSGDAVEIAKCARISRELFYLFSQIAGAVD